MRLTTFYLHAPSDPSATPAFVPIAGEWDSAEHAREIGIATATKNPCFVNWCIAFEIENEQGEIVSRWSLTDA